MRRHDQPLVAVLTPVFNEESVLAECIESVLAQTYGNFEYTIVDNHSTDRSLAIALQYAARDSRIRVHHNATNVGVTENHNIAFRLASPDAKYCKIVSADDLLFPDYLARVVETAEANPSAGFVGCYQQSGTQVRWQGFPYPQALINGRELGREMLLSRDPSFGFGSPTSLLYRADLVRKSRSFYPNASPHADTSVFYVHLRDCDYAFVYQVLCWERLREASESRKAYGCIEYLPATLDDVVRYARSYLTDEEYERKFAELMDAYYERLAVGVISAPSGKLLDYHRRRLMELGFPLRTSALLRAGAAKLVKEIANPAEAILKLRRRSAARARN
jgi:glycosyltransferase involved in cell wall biosynthesis